MRQSILNAAPFPELAEEDVSSLASLSRDLLDAPENTRGQLEARLDALVSALYGLDQDDLQVIFKTFHKNWEPTSHFKQVVTILEEMDATHA